MVMQQYLFTSVFSAKFNRLGCDDPTCLCLISKIMFIDSLKYFLMLTCSHVEFYGKFINKYNNAYVSIEGGGVGQN